MKACRICGETQPQQAFSKDRAKREVRGLLCRTCNAGLGHFRDSAKLMASAITYVEG